MAVAFCADPAGAAAPWSDPGYIPRSTDGWPRIAFASNGAGVAVWNDDVAAGKPGTSGASTTSRDGFAGAHSLMAVQVARLAAYGRGRVLLGGDLQSSDGPRAVIAFGAARGSVGALRAIGPRARSTSLLDLAANARGDAAALVTTCATEDCERSVPYLVVRRAGRPFAPPVRLAARGRALAGAVSVNEIGDVLAVWDTPRHGTTGPRDVHARIWSPGGRLGPEQVIGRAVTIPVVAAALGQGRRAVVGWLAQPVSEGYAAGPATIRAATAPASGRFGPAQLLERFDVEGPGVYVGQAGVRVSIFAARRAIMAWTGFQDGRFVVRAARVHAGRVLGAQTVSDPTQDTVLSDLARGPRGEALVVGLQGLRGNTPVPQPFPITPPGPFGGSVSVVAAARSPDGAAFGPPESVAGPAPYLEAAHTAFDPVSGRAVTVWRDLAAHAIGTATRAQVG